MSIFSSFFRSSGFSHIENLDDNMLNDIGLSRDDVRRASRMGSRAANYLQQRRATRANG